MRFGMGEYEDRTARLQVAMAEDGLDALLLTSPADVTYVTGFLTRFWESPTRPWFVVVPGQGAPVAVIPVIGAALMGRTWVTDIRTWDAPSPQDEGVSLLADALREAVPGGGRIGVPSGPEMHLRMPLGDYAKLTAELSPREIADGSHALRRVREIKSEAEIAAIRESCTIAGRAFARVPEVAGEGVPLARVFRDFQALLLAEGADWVSYLAGGAGPDGYGDVISPADEVPLARGDVLMVDTGAVRDGYFCDFDRNYAIGRAGEAARRAYGALISATEAALEALRPGMTAGEVHGLLAGALRCSGAVPCGGRLGHGLGLNLTEWPSFQPGDNTVLREGMVLTLEPGVELAPGRIMVHEENLVLRAGGAELLSPRAPEELPEIDP